MNENSINTLILRLELQKAQTNDPDLQKTYQFVIDKLQEELDFMIYLEKVSRKFP